MNDVQVDEVDALCGYHKKILIKKIFFALYSGYASLVLWLPALSGSSSKSCFIPTLHML